MVKEFIEFSKKVLKMYEVKSAVRMIITRFANYVNYRQITVERENKVDEYVKEYIRRNRTPWSVDEYTAKVTAIEIYPGKVVFHIIEWKG